MMHQGMALHGRTSRITDYMYHGHELSVRSRMAAVRAELAGAEGGDESADACDAAVAIGGVGGDEFVRVAAELDAGFAN